MKVKISRAIDYTNSPFSNGRQRAMNVISEKIECAGLFGSKVVYAQGPFKIYERNSQFGHDFVIHKGDFVVDKIPHKTLAEAKQALSTLR